MAGSAYTKSAATFCAKVAALAVCVTMLPGMQSRLGGSELRLLEAHNVERESEDLPPLDWDNRLEANARSYAEHLARSGKFEHSQNKAGQPLEGENLWRGTAGAFAPERMVGLWIAEKRHFIRGQFSKSSATGDLADVSHYTQIMWRKTNKVGCAVARGQEKEVLVCRYSRPGNVIGQTVF